jgi:drug/metabolite transporter (DMT)-like permease
MKLTAAPRLFLLTASAMTAFAANSILCRVAVRGGHIDPSAFTTLRLVSGALALWLMMKLSVRGRIGGDWGSALALAVYAAAFSFAYRSLTVGMGALLLFGAVQASMLISGFVAGERLKPLQGAGFALAVAGLVWLVLPGISAPPLLGAALMLAAGVAWGVYSLRGRGVSAPALATTGNFLRAAPLVTLASLPYLPRMHMDSAGVMYALASGVLASGLGYVIWYAALRGLTATRAAVVQLGAPVLAALGGVLFLGEDLTSRLVVASIAILGGIAMVVLKRGK